MGSLSLILLLHTVIISTIGQAFQPLMAIGNAGFLDLTGEKFKADAKTNAGSYLVEKMSRTDYKEFPWRSFFKADVTFGENRQLKLTSKCKSDLKAFRDALEKKERFAEEMSDAAGKMPSGVLEGNVAWLGAYDECRNVTAVTNSTSFKGEYCLGTVKLPQVSGLGFQYGICLPNSCNNDDASYLITQLLEIQFKMKANVTALCSHPLPYTAGDYVAIVICSLLGFLVLVGTVWDGVRIYSTTNINSSRATEQNGYNSVNTDTSGEVSERSGLLSKSSLAGTYEAAVSDLGIHIKPSPQRIVENIFLSFSVISNGKKLFNTHTSNGHLTALNGIRVLSMWWVIQGHTFGFSATFLDNIAIYPELAGGFLFQAVVNATFSVDSFFFLSGLLVAYLTLNAMRENHGKVNWAKFVLHRFWRLTPALAFCVMIFTTLLYHIMDGPMARTIQNTETVTVCKTKWWPNLLYINNFYPSYGDLGKQCFGWSWYLANDMQFYLISPFLLCLLYRWRWIGIGTVTFLITTCLIVTGVVARVYQMCAVGCPITHHTTDLYAKHDLIYNKPFTRISPYLVGMLTGYILSVTKCRLRMNKYLVALGWVLATAINISVLYGLYGLHHGEVFSPDMNAFYIGTSRFAWSVGLAWVAIACATGKGGPVNDILSWRVWAPLGHLTYCAYLVHPIVLYFYYINKRKPVHYTNVELSTLYVGNLVLSYAVAFVVSMLVEAPMLGLEKIMYKRK